MFVDEKCVTYCDMLEMCKSKKRWNICTAVPLSEIWRARSPVPCEYVYAPSSRVCRRHCSAVVG